MNQKGIKATLHNGGVDTGKYFSLQLEKGDLPEGSEIVIMVRDAATGEMTPLRTTTGRDLHAFAKKSRFYGQVMGDGHVFNPLTHRRFIAAQFRRLIGQFGCAGVHEGVSRKFNWNYAIGVLKKEIDSNALLYRQDRYGYEERSRFFTLQYCAKILEDYAAAVEKDIDRMASVTPGTHVFIEGSGMTLKKNLRAVKYKYVKLAEEAKACASYAQLQKLLENVRWHKFSCEAHLPWSFTNPYVEAGAYYTMKFHIMFEGLKVGVRNMQDSLAWLLEQRGAYLHRYETFMR